MGGPFHSPSTRPSKPPVSRPVRRLQVGNRGLPLIFVIASLYISMQAVAVRSEEDTGAGPKIHSTLLSFVTAHAGQATQQAAGRQADSEPPTLPPLLLKTLARSRIATATSADITSDGHSAESYYTELRVWGKLAPNATEPAVAEVLLSLGVDTYTFDLQTGVVYCWMPTSSIALLSEHTTGYVNAWLPDPASPNAGSAHSQGDYVMRTDLVRSLFRLDGSGVKVGILSDSFNALGGMAADISSGDLPSAGNIQILLDASGSDEGRAMAQIVHDVAPGAAIAFRTAQNNRADYAAAILALQAAGCQVMVDDYFYYEEPIFLDGRVAIAVDQVKSQGVAYFSSAGNHGRGGYSAPFRNSGVMLTESGWGNIGYMHDFDPDPAVTSTRLSLTIPSGGAYIMLQWDNLFYNDGPTRGTAPGAVYDLDAFLYQSNSMMYFLAWYNLLGDHPSATGDPYEILFIDTAGTYDLRITHYTGAGPSHMWFICYSGCTYNSGVYGTDSGTLYGHAKAAGAIAVGAAYYGDTPWNGVSPPELEWFSSRGGVPTYFDATGNYIPAGIIRQKPEVVGPDGVDTTISMSGDYDSSGHSDFYGTSAAVPHVAALAALMLQYQPSLTPDMIASVLKQTAIDMGVPGVDLDSGYGLVNATGVFQVLAEVCRDDHTGLGTDYNCGSTYPLCADLNGPPDSFDTNDGDNGYGFGCGDCYNTVATIGGAADAGCPSSAPICHVFGYDRDAVAGNAGSLEVGRCVECLVSPLPDLVAGVTAPGCPDSKPMCADLRFYYYAADVADDYAFPVRDPHCFACYDSVAGTTAGDAPDMGCDSATPFCGVLSYTEYPFPNPPRYAYGAVCAECQDNLEQLVTDSFGDGSSIDIGCDAAQPFCYDADVDAGNGGYGSCAAAVNPTCDFLLNSDGFLDTVTATCTSDLSILGNINFLFQECASTAVDLDALVAGIQSGLLFFIPKCAFDSWIEPVSRRRNLLQILTPQEFVWILRVYVRNTDEGDEVLDVLNSLAFRAYLTTLIGPFATLASVVNVNAVFELLASASSDPHFVTASGDKFDFNGAAGESYCIVTDKQLQINARFAGAASGNALPSSSVSNQTDTRTWMDQVAVMHGSDRILIDAASPAGATFSASFGSVLVNREPVLAHVLMKKLPSGVILSRKKSRLTVVVPGVAAVAVEVVRASFWEPGTGPGKNFLNMQVKQFNSTGAAHGVLGQSFASRTQVPVPKEGDAAGYRTSSIFASDCHFNQFIAGHQDDSVGAIKGTQHVL